MRSLVRAGRLQLRYVEVVCMCATKVTMCVTVTRCHKGMFQIDSGLIKKRVNNFRNSVAMRVHALLHRRRCKTVGIVDLL